MNKQITLASSSWSISLGQDLRARLDAVAREQALDATSLGRRVVAAYVEKHEQQSEGDHD